MEHAILPKFKKGQLVSFDGANHLASLSKTFIHAVDTDDHINYFYLIEHPSGKILIDQTKHEFTGFDITKLKQGLKYISAQENELTAVEQPKPAVVESAAPIIKEQVIDEPITFTTTKSVIDSIIGATASQYMAFKNNKIIVMMQAQLDDETYNAILKSTETALIQFKTQGFIDSLEEFGIEVPLMDENK